MKEVTLLIKHPSRGWCMMGVPNDWGGMRGVPLWLGLLTLNLAHVCVCDRVSWAMASRCWWQAMTECRQWSRKWKRCARPLRWAWAGNDKGDKMVYPETPRFFDCWPSWPKSFWALAHGGLFLARLFIVLSSSVTSVKLLTFSMLWFCLFVYFFYYIKWWWPEGGREDSSKF